MDSKEKIEVLFGFWKKLGFEEERKKLGFKEEIGDNGW